jgi:hypothetical protein
MVLPPDRPVIHSVVRAAARESIRPRRSLAGPVPSRAR